MLSVRKPLRSTRRLSVKMENFASDSTEQHMAGNLMQCSLHRTKTKPTLTDHVCYCISKTDRPQFAKFLGCV